MLSSIHPLGERARSNRWSVTVGWFTAGSTATAAAIGAGLGWLGGIAPWNESTRTWTIATVVAAAGVLDLAKVRAPGPERQVNERWIGHYRGWVYGAGFGAQLGAGIATYVVSWGVYAVFLAEVLIGSPVAGAAVGAAFGFGRSLAVLGTFRIDRPSRLSAFHARMDRLGRPVHVSSAVTLIAMAIVFQW
jgi:cytochrome c biogenesis protein CcdA